MVYYSYIRHGNATFVVVCSVGHPGIGKLERMQSGFVRMLPVLKVE